MLHAVLHAGEQHAVPIAVGRFAGAIRGWLGADPDDADAWFARGLAQSRLQQSREAMSALAKATELAPNHADAWFELGIASLEARDAAAAERARDALAGMGSKLAGKLQHMMR